MPKRKQTKLDGMVLFDFNTFWFPKPAILGQFK